MKARWLLPVCALGFAGASFAAAYPEERGIAPSVVPPSPDESGVVRNVPEWRSDAFERADANGDRVLSRSEFQDAAVLAVNERNGLRGE